MAQAQGRSNSERAVDRVRPPTTEERAAVQQQALEERERQRETMAKLADLLLPKLPDALPRYVTPAAFKGAVLTMLRLNPELLQCTPASLMGALLECALLGLLPGPQFQLVHLVPRRNAKRKCKEATVVIDYRGLGQLAMLSGVLVAPPVAREVRGNDYYEIELGTDEHIRFKPALTGPRGDPIFYFAVLRQKGGIARHEIMILEEMLDHRDRHAPKFEGKIVGPWADFEDRMRLKTVVRRGLSQMPRTGMLARALMVDEVEDRTDRLGQAILDGTPVAELKQEAQLEVEAAKDEAPAPDPEPRVDPEDQAWLEDDRDE